MTPQMFLAILVGLTLVVLLIDGFVKGRRRDAVRRLAIELKLNFAAVDTLQLCARLTPRLPFPGVSAPRVYNLIYGLDGDTYRYYFTIDYTLGVTDSKRRVSRVAAYVEPRDRRRGGQTTLTLADDDLPVMEQYRSVGVRDGVSGA